MLDNTQEVSIDEAYRSVGEFGKGQIWLFFLISLYWIPSSLQTMLFQFAEQDPIRERLWECTNDNKQSCQNLVGCSVNSCHETLNQQFCSLNPEQWQWTHQDWSVLSDLNYHCQGYFAQLAQSMYFLGYLVGAGFFGWVSDKYGRKRGLLIAIILSSIFGILTSSVPTIWWYGLLRALTGFGNAGVGVIIFTLVTEIVGPSWRGWVGISTMYFFTVGACLSSLVSWLLPNWRLLNFLYGIWMFMSIFLWPQIPESPRWLLVQGRKGEATAILAAIAASNKMSLPEYPLQNIQPVQNQHGLRDILKHDRLRYRMIIMVYVWCVVSMCFYGISLSLGSLSGSLYLNSFLISLIEVPATLMACILIDRVGRKATFSWCLLEAGTAYIVCGLTFSWGQRAMALLSKFGAAAAFNMAYIYTAELFPTVVRNIAIGTASLSARFGGIIAPVLIAGGNAVDASWLPFLLFGGMTLGAGLVSLLLPETFGTSLPETIQEVQLSGGRWFSLFRRNRKGMFDRLGEDDDEKQ
eukprot:TRINITY_DN24625_c0_g1_i4.p3 TRINITY_DN24625_c0_g1~~TRINITY_DN24625_c0_g1_i4.p3  ORF type:complete len:522 (+),score=44.76 TRINITY_DN24625_c0_g1_i4:245-1810(+)